MMNGDVVGCCFDYFDDDIDVVVAVGGVVSDSWKVNDDGCYYCQDDHIQCDVEYSKDRSKETSVFINQFNQGNIWYASTTLEDIMLKVNDQLLSNCTVHHCIIYMGY